MYISLASYRDPMLQSTIDSAFKNADRPEDLFVGCFISIIKDAPDTKSHLVNNNYNGKVQVETEEAGKIFSVTRARNKAAQWLKPEHEYLIQVDSHTRFMPGWDTQLIESYKRLNHSKALFSTYVPSWFPTTKGEVYLDWPGTHVLVSTYKEEESDAKKCLFGTYEIVPSHLHIENLSKTFYRTWHMAGMFQFGPAEYYLNNPQPEWICFWGEELYNSCVAFTKGWDVYVPDVMPIRQMYPQDISVEANIKYFGNPEGPHKNWRDFSGTWHKAKEVSTDLIIDALIEKKTGPGYLGTQRSIEELYNFIGYDIAELYRKWRDEYRQVH